MPRRIDHSFSYDILRQAIFFDTQKRFEILREEIEHFISSVQYRSGVQMSGDASTSTHSHSIPRFPTPNSQSAFLARLAESANQLKLECAYDIAEIADFEACWLANHNEILAALSGEAAYSRVDQHDCFAIVWNSKLHEKAIVIAERLGDLHDRLEQFLQRTNPDHPDPTLRRRSEQGLTDKYLSEFSRWVHRDIAVFAKSLGAHYPYNSIPATYQSWAYDRTSRQHSFMPLKAHIQWKQRIESVQSSTAKLNPEKFTAVSLSYWIPERPTLVPIIGHELAHQVLRDLYGREMSFPTLEGDESELGRVMRRVTGAVESWLSTRLPIGRSEPKVSSNLVQEIMCDCMAAVRFGYGYVYAWILETISDERFAQLFHDEYGMLRRFVDPTRTSTSANEDSSVSSNLGRLEREALLNARRLQLGIFSHYYRGRVLARLLGEINLEADSCARGLQVAFDRFLNLMLQIYTDGDEQRATFEAEMARDIASKVVEEWGSDDGSDGYGGSTFVKLAQQYWSRKDGSLTLNSFTLQRQELNHTYRRLVSETVTKRCATYYSDRISDLADMTDVGSVRTLTDLTWRLEWLTESVKNTIAGPNASNHSVDDLRGDLRALNFLGMDDYLIRTANPIRLFSVLIGASNSTARALVIEAGSDSNTLSSDQLERIYSVVPLKELDRNMMSSPSNASVTLGGQLLQLDKAHVNWIAYPLLDKDLWQRVVRQPVHYVLELLKIRNDTGALGRDMRIQQRTPVEPYLRSKYEVITSEVLLGRYDAMVLHQQKSKDGQIGWEIRVNGSNDNVHAEIVTRAKRVVRVYGNDDSNPITNRNAVVAIVLVSLKWDASRPLVARWLAESKILDPLGNLRVDGFLSDGWEDLVLIASIGERSDEDRGITDQLSDQTNKGIANVLSIIKDLNSNPFVSSTETLFSKRIIDNAPSYLHFRFAFRVGVQGFEEAREKLIKICNEFHLGLQEVSGNKDFELIVPSDKNSILGELHARFHNAAEASYRVETRVAWGLERGA